MKARMTIKLITIAALSCITVAAMANKQAPEVVYCPQPNQLIFKDNTVVTAKGGWAGTSANLAASKAKTWQRLIIGVWYMDQYFFNQAVCIYYMKGREAVDLSRFIKSNYYLYNGYEEPAAQTHMCHDNPHNPHQNCYWYTKAI